MNESRQPRCPICRKASEHQFRPFCSRRCADIDLGRWLSGGYAIEAREDDELSSETNADGDAAGRLGPGSGAGTKGS